MASMTEPKKTLDLPPSGPGNLDPISGKPGAHPIETGVGAALGGAATGFAAGVLAGPIGAVAGAIIGGVAGGYAGKEAGEYIDPTSEDSYLRDEFETRDYAQDGDYDTFQPVYRHGAKAESNNVGKSFAEIETGLQTDYENQPEPPPLPWERARGALADGYDRAAELRKKRGCSTKK